MRLGVPGKFQNSKEARVTRTVRTREKAAGGRLRAGMGQQSLGALQASVKVLASTLSEGHTLCRP